ncbi:hypothetical protein J437_LFUL017487 [Ladona fulva]|uniref:Dynein heavy chain tail domain-containing protein n=1 Tax=Ladona fulva TaxID=123851 RepID=A0A8K0P9B3_LADFU|nr:hypothetical protein J437_LFUL017487 [Ladona fulva]
MMESEQLRRENDSSGPQDELEYWKRRGAQFSQIVAHLQAQEVQLVLMTLQLSHSRVFKVWQETDRKITFCFNEARDNAKFIQAMEKCCHCLYLHDPVKMRDSLLSLLKTVRLIHSVSQFYNTSERTSSLMIKITNQMIETCKNYITCRGKETIWTQGREEVRERLKNCVQLNRMYRETYLTVKEQDFLPGRTPFGFSENYVFGKFDSFCDRLNKIIALFDLIDDYNSLFERRMEALEEAMKTFDDAKAGVTTKNYDYLDHRNKEFDADLKEFLKETDQLKESISELIEANFANVWETPQGIRFLLRFEKVSEKIPLSRMDEKYDRVLKYCEKEVDRILKMFRRQRDDPPLPRYFPPIAGRIKWVRSLKSHLEDMVESISSHPVLRILPATSDLLRKHLAVCVTLNSYESEITNIWMNHNVWVVDDCLSQNILCLCPDTGRLKVNLDQRIRLLIREAGCLAKMSIPIPIVTLTLLSKQDYFTTVNDSMQLLLNQFLSTVSRVKLEVRPLFLPQLVRLTALLTPGLNIIKWTDSGWKYFYTATLEAVKQFDVLVTRVHDVYTNRILQVLSSMQKVTLHILPEDEPSSVEEFVERTETNCIQAALELNRKSLMVEEAVEEILELVRRAALAFKGNSDQDIFDFLTDPEAKTKKQASQGEGGEQQQDWTAVWACFDEPHTLLQQAGGIGLSKGMQQMVRNAVSEMRRYYSRKVVDVLTRATRQSLDAVRRRFTVITSSLSDSGVVKTQGDNYEIALASKLLERSNTPAME